MTRAEQEIVDGLVTGLTPGERRTLAYGWHQKRRPRALYWSKWGWMHPFMARLRDHGILESCHDVMPGSIHSQYCSPACYRPTKIGWKVLLAVRELRPALEAGGYWDLLDWSAVEPASYVFKPTL